MEKSQWRKKMIANLQALTNQEREKVSKKLIAELLQSNLWKNAKSIGVTISRGFEWDTNPIIDAAWQEKKAVCVPKCEPKTRKMTFHQLTSYEQLEEAYFGLLEPIVDLTEKMHKDRIDLLLVPGVVFDRSGFRIGFGGGYYDRFLSDFPNMTVSLLHSMQLIERVPKEEFDIPVEHLITEEGIFSIAREGI